MDFCSIASGSSGNCIYVGSDRASVLVDTGISAKRIQEGLRSIDRKPEDISGILITHEHSDHIQGLGVVSRKYHIPIYATPATIRQIKRYSALGNIDPELFHEIHAGEAFEMKDLKVKPFHISHDAADPVGYRLEHDGKSVAVATDMGCYDDALVDTLKDLDAVLVESNHDVNMLQVGRYPYPLKMRIMSEKGHLSNDACGILLRQILNDHMKAVFLGHLSKENNYAALAYATVAGKISEDGSPYRADDFDISVAERDHVSRFVEV